MFGARPLPRTLEAALRDRTAEKAEVRASALRDLVAHAGEAHEQVVRALQRALREDEAADVRAVAATALADLRAGEALPELLFAVEDAAPYVRQMAIAALGEIGDSRATERLRRALGDERAEVRFQAVMAFPRVSADPKGALDALLRATTDVDPFVCHIALRMTEEVCEGGSPDERVLARARAILGDSGKSAEVQVAAAILLARTGDARAVAVLTKVVQGEIRTRDAEDEATAIELCGELGIEAAQRGLEKRAFGGVLGIGKHPLFCHARVALARMGHPRACREIMRELGDRNRDVRTLAVAAAGRARLAAVRDRILAMRGDPARADPTAVDEALALIPASPSPPPRAPAEGSPRA